MPSPSTSPRLSTEELRELAGMPSAALRGYVRKSAGSTSAVGKGTRESARLSPAQPGGPGRRERQRRGGRPEPAASTDSRRPRRGPGAAVITEGRGAAQRSVYAASPAEGSPLVRPRHGQGRGAKRTGRGRGGRATGGNKPRSRLSSTASDVALDGVEISLAPSTDVSRTTTPVAPPAQATGIRLGVASVAKPGLPGTSFRPSAAKAQGRLPAAVSLQGATEVLKAAGIDEAELLEMRKATEARKREEEELRKARTVPRAVVARAAGGGRLAQLRNMMSTPSGRRATQNARLHNLDRRKRREDGPDGGDGVETGVPARLDEILFHARPDLPHSLGSLCVCSCIVVL